MSNLRFRLKSPKAVRVWRAGLVLPLILAVSLILVRLGIQFIPGFGPSLADGLRAVLGAPAVTVLQEGLAKLEDQWDQLTRSHEAPRSIVNAVPRVTPELVTAPAPAEKRTVAKPENVGPMASRVAAEDDGNWFPVSDPAAPSAPPILFTTLLHPDVRRPWSEVFVVAVSVEEIRLRFVAGTQEPVATTPEGKRYQRTGLIPEQAYETLLAAFNGGFKTQHGRHGAYLDSVTLVPPQDHLCTIVGFAEGRLEIGTFRKLREEVQRRQALLEVDFLRQGAPCMYEASSLNPMLRDEDTKNWGATLDGDVIIRRSAIGLDAKRRFLFFGVSNATSARAMAQAMNHAGATDVAQLDVNWSYPKFLMFPRESGGERQTEGLFKGFFYRDGEYLKRPSGRDFFYLVYRRDPSETASEARAP